MRDAAEAIFRPKPQVAFEDRPSEAVTRQPRVLPVLPASDELAADETPSTPTPTTFKVPRSELARICTWEKYGMTHRQVADHYGVDVDQIVQILRAFD